MADKLVRGKNDLSSLYPELAAEWDHEKNEGLDPDMVLPGSGKRVWWKCACGHEWKTAIYHRTAGHGCKICASRKAVLKPGVNDLATRCPELSEDWDFEKNDPLGPSDVPMYSQASVWWKCSKGHSWKNTVSHRIQGQGCPYCAGNRILPGFNDIVTLKVSYLKDWDFRKNHDVKPEMLGPGSTKKVWWRCPKGHSWEAAVYSRTAGSGCPYCAGNRLVPGVNDIATAFPELVSEWDYDRNNGITPDMVAKTAARSYWWICPQGHSYSSSPGSRARGCGCIYCAGKRLMKGFNDFASQYPELLKEWDWDKNAGIKPDEIPCNRHKKVWWTDSQGHSWKATTSNRIRGCGCPYCANRVVLQGFNDLSTLQPDLAKEWDYERNAPLKPDMITAGSHRSVWWKCHLGHSWRSPVSTRNSNHTGCPYCSNFKVLKGFNDFEHHHPELKDEWNYERNKIKKWDEVHGDAAPDEAMVAFLESSNDSYAILQLRHSDETAFERFMSLDYLKRQDKEPDIDHYEVVYTAPLLPYKDVNTMLEETYVKFNMDRPSDFTGHSLSVSDIVALKQSGVVSCHYVDSIGFKELPNFLKPENYLKYAEMSMEDDYGMIDGVINNGKKDESVERESVLEKLKEKQEEPPCIRCPKKPEERGLE